MELRQFNICVRTEAPQFIIQSQKEKLMHTNERPLPKPLPTAAFLVEYSRRKLMKVYVFFLKQELLGILLSIQAWLS
jgi:hypothetical protein